MTRWNNRKSYRLTSTGMARRSQTWVMALSWIAQPAAYRRAA